MYAYYLYVLIREGREGESGGNGVSRGIYIHTYMYVHMYTYDDDNRVIWYLEFIELEYKPGWVGGIYSICIYICIQFILYTYNSYYICIIHIIYV